MKMRRVNETERDIIQSAVVAYMTDNDSAVPTLNDLLTSNYLMSTPKYIVGGDINVSTGAVTHDCSS